MDEFSGRFDAAGDPILTRQKVYRSAPIMRPAPGQIFQGQWLPQERPPTGNSCLVLETTTGPLVFRCNDPFSGSKDINQSRFLRVEALSIDTSGSGSRSTWLIYERQSDQQWQILNPLPAEIAAAMNPQAPASSLVPTLSNIDDEMVYLKSELDQVNWEMEPQLSWNSALQRGKLQVLGSLYRKSLVTIEIRQRELTKIEAHLRQYAPERIRIGTDPPVFNDERWSHVKDEHLRARKELEGFEALAYHPKLRPLIDKVAQQMLLKDRAIRVRLRQLADQRATLSSRDASQSKKVDAIGQGTAAPQECKLTHRCHVPPLAPALSRVRGSRIKL